MASNLIPVNTTSQSVGSFQSQQLGALNSGRAGSAVAPGTNALLAGMSKPLTASQQLAKNSMDNTMAAGQRLQGIKQVGYQKAALEQAKAQEKQRVVQMSAGNQRSSGKSGGSLSTASYSTGKAWTPNGSLSSARNTVLSEASSYLGTPYVLGGASRRSIDCSGLVMLVYGKVGMKLGHGATIQKNSMPGNRVSNINALRPGDIVAWKDGSHIAIYAGNGEIIEAANPKRGTLRRKLWANPNAVFGIQVRLPGE